MKKLILVILFLIGFLIGQYLTKEKDISTTSTHEEETSHDYELTYPTQPTCEYILAQEGILV